MFRALFVEDVLGRSEFQLLASRVLRRLKVSRLQSILVGLSRFLCLEGTRDSQNMASRGFWESLHALLKLG